MLRKILHLVKKLFILAFILAVLLAVGITFFVLTFDLNRYKGLAERKLTSTLRRPVTIESMDTKLAVVPTITIKGFRIANNEPFQDKDPLLSIQKMDAELELIPLFRSQINIHKVDNDTAKINLYKTEQANNWSFEDVQNKTNNGKNQADAANKVSKISNNLRLDNISIHSMDVAYNDTQKQYNLVAQNVKVKQFHTLDAEITYNNQPITISVNAGTLFNFLNKSPNFPVDVKLKSKIANINLNGKIGNLAKFSNVQATVSAQTQSLTTFLNFFNIRHDLIPKQRADLQLQVTGDLDKMEVKKLQFQLNGGKDLSVLAKGKASSLLKNPTITLDVTAQLPQGAASNLWHIQPFSLAGDYVLSLQGIQTKKTTIDANRSDLNIAADIKKTSDNTYNVNLSLISDFLNPEDFFKTEKNTATNDGDSTNQAKNDDPVIPWKTLDNIKGNFNINISHLQVGNWLAGYIGIRTQAAWGNNQLKAPFKITILDGQLDGELQAQATQQTIALSGTASHLNLNGLRALQKDLQNVLLDARINLNTKGATRSTLLKNLTGKVSFQTDQGQIINEWFVNLLKLLNQNKQKQNVAFSNADNHIKINCAAANMTIQQGVIKGTDQFALETNSLDFLAGGTIDLNQKTMDVVLQPTLANNNKANEILEYSKFIRISGPFDKPVPKVDTQQTAESLLQAGLNKLANVTPQNTTAQKASLCKQVLGLDSLTKQKTAPQQPAPTAKATQKNAAAPTPQSNKKQFQEQLLNTLFETLKNP